MKTKQERQAETAAMTKCSCGNIAQVGKTMCNRCEHLKEELAEDIDDGMFLRSVALAQTGGDTSIRLLKIAQRLISGR